MSNTSIIQVVHERGHCSAENREINMINISTLCTWMCIDVVVCGLCSQWMYVQ